MPFLPKDRASQVGQTHFPARTRSVHCAHFFASIGAYFSKHCAAKLWPQTRFITARNQHKYHVDTLWEDFHPVVAPFWRAVGFVACLSVDEQKRRVMAIPIDVFDAEALSLPQADRSRLVERFLASLGHHPAWKKAWSEDAYRREACVVDGRAQWVSGPKAVARIRASLK